jgi:glycosyltransferase involved in cell wall biosynthesis
MNKQPSISVVINNHNNGKLLTECVDSVLSQTDAPEEIILVDDGSHSSEKFEIEAMLSRYPSIKAIFTEPQGQLACIATGISSATSDVLLFLDGDDRFLPRHVETMRARWGQFGKADLMYCRFAIFGEPAMIEARRSRYRGDDPSYLLGPIDLEASYDWGYSMALTYFMPGLFLGNVTSTLSMRKSHARSLGLMEFGRSGTFRVNISGDYFLLLSSALSGGKRVYVPDRTVEYRVHGKSDSLTNFDNYVFYARRFAMEDWLLNRVPRSPARMRKLLELELSTAPCPSPGHAALYRKAKKIARRQMSAAERLNSALSRGLHDVRLFLYRKGIDTFGKR